MKNLPDKIYVTPNFDRRWQTNAIDDESVEFVRKDAFIEKAENFLEMLGYGFTITDNITHKNYDKEQLIADFRNYIK